MPQTKRGRASGGRGTGMHPSCPHCPPPMPPLLHMSPILTVAASLSVEARPDFGGELTHDCCPPLYAFSEGKRQPRGTEAASLKETAGAPRRSLRVAAIPPPPTARNAAPSKQTSCRNSKRGGGAGGGGGASKVQGGGSSSTLSGDLEDSSDAEPRDEGRSTQQLRAAEPAGGGS